MPKLTEFHRNCPYHVILTFSCTEREKDLTHFGSICISEYFTSWTICCYTCVLCIFDSRRFMTWNCNIWSGEPHKCVDKWTFYINLVQKQHANFHGIQGQTNDFNSIDIHTVFTVFTVFGVLLCERRNLAIKQIIRWIDLKWFRSFDEYLFRITRTEGNEKWLEQISKCTSATLNTNKQLANLTFNFIVAWLYIRF